ncbi:MAG TPA: DNA polymerase III subunit alpha [Chitinophagales bacterium]|nr:DNA polymerase III subunit alpha [Chitinophagales bacterium]
MYLNCHSCFSLNYGIMQIDELLAYASGLGIRTMALTDINNTSGCLDFLRLAHKHRIQPVVGVDFRNGNQQLYVCLAKSNEGFRQINEFLSEHKISKKDFPAEAPALPDCYIIYPWQRKVTRFLKPNEFIGIRPEDITHYRLYEKKYTSRQHVMLSSASFRNKKDFNTHRLLRAIYNNALLSKLPTTEHGKQTDMFYTLQHWADVYADIPKAATNASDILKHCHVSFTFNDRTSKNKKYFTGSAEDDIALLKTLANDGLLSRYTAPPQNVIDRFNTEMQTIIELRFTAYFLINWDIIQYASHKGYFYIGRGSGANSLIAYCLQITDVDPIELDLYFERFINPSRKNPPDFDIDFSHTDRDDIRQYIFNKYEGHAALVGSYSTFERKSSIRQIGKVFGLPDEDIENLQSEWVDKSKLDHYGTLVLKYAEHIAGLPNQLSVHACGILISELPITCYTALELMPVGFVSTQFSMLEAEDVGLYKFDILSQRGLGHIKDAVSLVKTNKGQDIDIHRIQDFKEDERIRQMLMVGDTIGCFYVESPAMRQLMRKLEVQDYLGLVAASSVIRPGVASSGMMRQYILRYRYQEEREKAHPVLKEIMPETFGVMVYQEDVIKVAHIYAGLTLEEADVMRRGMSGKFRSRVEFQQVREKFFSNCKAKGYPVEDSAEIWRQIESFAGYSFAKGHSASYAVESYQSLYLRAYHPIEFITGVLNNFGGFYTTEFYLHEAKMLGATIELPCINNSDNLARLTGTTIYMGFCMIKDLEQGTIKAILDARQAGGPFFNLNDIINRVPISLEQLRILIRIKALRFTGKTSKELLWDAHMVLSKTKKTAPRKELFKLAPEPTTLPPLEYTMYEDAHDEMQILGFPFTNPFALLKQNYKGLVYAKELLEHLGKVVYLVGYYVNIKRVTTIHGDTMYFGSFIDERGHLFDTVHFPQSINRYPFTGKGCYIIKGTVIEDFNVPSVDVSNMLRINWGFAE